jgi:hypothetical protein
MTGKFKAGDRVRDAAVGVVTHWSDDAKWVAVSFGGIPVWRSPSKIEPAHDAAGGEGLAAACVAALKNVAGFQHNAGNHKHARHIEGGITLIASLQERVSQAKDGGQRRMLPSCTPSAIWPKPALSPQSRR